MKYFALLLLPFVLFGQYDLVKDVISSGGTKATSTNYVLYGTVSQTTIGSVAGGTYKGIIGFWQPFDWIAPNPPDVVRAVKSSDNVVLTWNKVTTDVNGNPEVIEYYTLYRDTTPNYMPGSGSFLGNSVNAETTYTDVGAHSASSSYYYLVKAVDYGRNYSIRSNMGFKFNKFLNENAAATDMNWVSLPYRSIYGGASNITDDMSPNGTSIIQLTDLRSDQFYDDWFYVEGIGWLGTDFTIEKGRGYEFVVNKDTTTVFAGAHDPVFRAPLVENPSATDMNWVSVPYNATYATVSNITDEYSPGGNPLVQVTCLRADQFYDDWFYIEGIGWLGTDFTIERGCAYEYVVTVDTTWHPTVFSNQFITDLAYNKIKKEKKNVYREPTWKIAHTATDNVLSNADNEKSPTASKTKTKITNRHEPHLVVALIDLPNDIKELGSLTFTAYCLSHPEKALFEGSVGCGYVAHNGQAVVWVQFGNLPVSWQADEEVMLIVEMQESSNHMCAVKKLKLEKDNNPQYIDDMIFAPMPIPVMDDAVDNQKLLHWDGYVDLQDDVVLGYSVYCDDVKMNNEIINGTYMNAPQSSNYALQYVFVGGYETSLVSQRTMATGSSYDTPIQYSLGPIAPNPFSGSVRIAYAIPVKTDVNICIYDIAGRRINMLVNFTQKPGNYSTAWHGQDDVGRSVPAGIYFIRMNAGDYCDQMKIILAK